MKWVSQVISVSEVGQACFINVIKSVTTPPARPCQVVCFLLTLHPDINGKHQRHQNGMCPPCPDYSEGHVPIVVI